MRTAAATFLGRSGSAEGAVGEFTGLDVLGQDVGDGRVVTRGLVIVE